MTDTQIFDFLLSSIGFHGDEVADGRPETQPAAASVGGCGGIKHNKLKHKHMYQKHWVGLVYFVVSVEVVCVSIFRPARVNSLGRSRVCLGLFDVILGPMSLKTSLNKLSICFISIFCLMSSTIEYICVFSI